MSKIDLYDRKILYELDVNTRSSISDIAKKVRLSKQAVSQRIQKMQNEKIIDHFLTIGNPGVLGFLVYKVYIKLQDLSVEEEEKLMINLSSNSSIVWLVSTSGRFDLIIGITVKRPADFENVYYDITKSFSKFIKEKTVVQNIIAHEYNRKHLLEKIDGARKRTTLSFLDPNKQIRLDYLDLKILNVLSQNARIPIMDIASTLKLSGRLVSYRINKMEKEGIIDGYRCVFDRSLLGLQFYKILFNTRSLDEKTKKKLFSYCEFCPEITAIVQCIGAWDIEIETEISSIERFRYILKEIRNLLSDELGDYDSLLIVKEHKLDYFTDVIHPLPSK